METKNNSYFQFSFCLFNTTIQEIPSLDQEKTKVEPGQPQLSPGISTIHLHPQFPVVIEKTSPPVPVAVAPEASTSSASQVIAPTQVTGRCDIYVI